MNFKKYLALAAPLLLGACAIHQKVQPVAQFSAQEICVIENTAVRASFLEAYQRALAAQGYTVRRLGSSASVNDCSVTSTYSASWRWDLALYMAYADLKNYHQGVLAGSANYDAMRGGGNMGKFIDADQKITELTQQLLPARTGL